MSDQDGDNLNWISIINHTQAEAEADTQEQKDLEDGAQKEFKTQLEQQVHFSTALIYPFKGTYQGVSLHIKLKICLK